MQLKSNPTLNPSQDKNDVAPPDWTKEEVRKLLAGEETPVADVSSLLIALFKRQEQDEKDSRYTAHRNGVGFSLADAPFLSAVAESSQRHGGFLTRRQDYWVRKRLIKYAGQLADALNSGEVTLPSTPPVIRWRSETSR